MTPEDRHSSSRPAERVKDGRGLSHAQSAGVPLDPRIEVSYLRSLLHINADLAVCSMRPHGPCAPRLSHFGCVSMSERQLPRIQRRPDQGGPTVSSDSSKDGTEPPCVLNQGEPGPRLTDEGSRNSVYQECVAASLVALRGLRQGSCCARLCTRDPRMTHTRLAAKTDSWAQRIALIIRGWSRGVSGI